MKQNGDDKRRNHIRKEERTERVRIWMKIIDFPSLEFSKLCLEVEANIITCSKVVLNIHRGNT